MDDKHTHKHTHTYIRLCLFSSSFISIHCPTLPLLPWELGKFILDESPLPPPLYFCPISNYRRCWAGKGLCAYVTDCVVKRGKVFFFLNDIDIYDIVDKASMGFVRGRFLFFIFLFFSFYPCFFFERVVDAKLRRQSITEQKRLGRAGENWRSLTKSKDRGGNGPVIYWMLFLSPEKRLLSLGTLYLRPNVFVFCVRLCYLCLFLFPDPWSPW